LGEIAFDSTLYRATQFWAYHGQPFHNPIREELPTHTRNSGMENRTPLVSAMTYFQHCLIIANLAMRIAR
jgi:hypothetical protein